MDDIDYIIQKLKDSKLVGIEKTDDGCRLDFDNDISLFIDGSYTKNLDFELKRRTIAFESI